MHKIVTILMFIMLLTSCGNYPSQIQDAKSESHEQPEQIQLQNQSDEIEEEQDCFIENMALGYRFAISQSFYDVLQSDPFFVEYDTDFAEEIEIEPFYMLFGEVRQPLFTIYRIPQLLSEEALKEICPPLIYLGTDYLATFAIRYAEDPEAELSEEQSQQYYVLMQNEATKILNTFELDALI